MQLRRLAAMLDLELLANTYELDKPVVETEVERNGVTYTTKTVNPAWRAGIASRNGSETCARSWVSVSRQFAGRVKHANAANNCQ